MKKSLATSALAGVLAVSALPCRAQVQVSGAQLEQISDMNNRLREIKKTSEAAKTDPVNAARAEPADGAEATATRQVQDVPGIREAVSRLTVGVNCVAGNAGYSLRPISADLGPALSAYGASLQSEYLYPQKNGLSLALKDDGGGTALWIGASDAEMRKVGELVPDAGGCVHGYADLDLRLDGAVTAALSIEPRLGIFSPACYKNITEGFYELNTWTVLTLSFPEGPLTVKTVDSKAFSNKGDCRAFYEQLTANH